MLTMFIQWKFSFAAWSLCRQMATCSWAGGEEFVQCNRSVNTWLDKCPHFAGEVPTLCGGSACTLRGKCLHFAGEVSASDWRPSLCLHLGVGKSARPGWVASLLVPK